MRGSKKFEAVYIEKQRFFSKIIAGTGKSILQFVFARDGGDGSQLANPTNQDDEGERKDDPRLFINFVGHIAAAQAQHLFFNNPSNIGKCHIIQFNFGIETAKKSKI